MFKGYCICLAVYDFTCSGRTACFAAEENVPQQTVYDDAALLTPEEIETLESELDAAGEKTGWNMLMLTTDDTNGKTTQEYADDFFDAIAENGDGVALLIDMQNREICISTGGILRMRVLKIF